MFSLYTVCLSDHFKISLSVGAVTVCHLRAPVGLRTSSEFKKLSLALAQFSKFLILKCLEIISKSSVLRNHYGYLTKTNLCCVWVGVIVRVYWLKRHSCKTTNNVSFEEDLGLAPVCTDLFSG